MDSHQLPEQGAFANRQVLRWGLAVFLVVAGYFLITEHRAHVVQALPWLLLLACPLMHLFMHRGHRSRHDGEAPTSADRSGTAHDDHEREHAGHGCH